MTICDYCGKDFKIVYTCNLCHGRFCSDHKKPHKHECKSLDLSEKNLLEESNSVKEVAVVEKSAIYNSEPNFADSLDIDKRNGCVTSSNSNNEDLPPESFLSYLFEPVSNENAEYCQNDDLNISTQIEFLNDGIKFNSLSDTIDEPINIHDKDLDTFEGSSANLKTNNLNVKDSLNINNSNKTDVKNGKFLTIKLILATVLILSFAVNGFLYTEYQDYQELTIDYSKMYNNTITLQTYYETLTDQYAVLRQEYSKINNVYADLSSSHNKLEDEYNAVMNYKMNEILDEDKKITLGPGQNISVVYRVPFSGIIDLNYTATGETYLWVGSSNLNGYYSRIPQFPETASELEFTLPVYPDIIIYFANPSELESLTITYSLNFTY